MRRSAVILAVVVVALTAIAWLQSPAHLTAAEALDAADGAFAAAQVPATLRGAPSPGTYRPGDAMSPIPVWKVDAAIGQGNVQLWLARADGDAVYLDDRSPDGTERLLTEEQFAALRGYRSNPALSRQLRRDLLATVAGLCITLLAVRIAAVLSDRPLTQRQLSRT